MNNTFKHLFVIALLSSALPTTLAAQTYLEVDFSKLLGKKTCFVSGYKQKVKIKIININRFLYNVSENQSDSEYNITMPAILSTLALAPAISSQASTNADRSLKVEKMRIVPKDSASIHQLIIKDLMVIIKAEANIDSMIVVHNDCVNLSRSCNLTGKEICLTAQNKITGEVAKDGLPPGTMIEMADTWEQYAVNAIGTANASYAQMEMLFKEWKKASLQATRDALDGKNESLVEEKFKLDQMTDALKIKKTGKEKRDELDAILAQQKLVGDIQTDITRMSEDLQNKTKDEQDLMDNAKALLTDLNTYTASGKIYTLGDDLKRINESNYTYYSELIKTKKDVMKFNFAVTTNGLTTCNLPNEQPFEVDIKTRGGLKVDFSTGVFINWGSANFYGRSFYIKPVADSMATIASPNEKYRALLSVGAFAHFYKRSPSKVKLGGSLGVSLSTGETVVNLHVGPSLIIGNQNRLILTAGLTLRQGTLLDNSYSTNTIYNTNLLPATVPTITKFPMTGYFIALTYDLSNL